MARQESDREDLLREATALVERIELILVGCAEPIVCGFRRDGSASFFFGADPVYQFNSIGQLRRAFVAGRLIKAEQGRLVALSRERSEHEIALVRHELADGESALLVADMGDRLSRLEQALQDGRYSVNGEVPPGANVAGRLLEWLKNRPPKIEIAAAPNVG
jgi:hypothetical protein